MTTTAAPPAPAVEKQIVLPERVVATLLQFGLRTEPGRAYWEGFITDLVEKHPWLEGNVAFRPGKGVVVPQESVNGTVRHQEG